MGIAALDFETYYDTDYTLSKISTEEYIRSPLFEAIMVSISMNGAAPVPYVGAQIEPALRAIDWDNNSILCWNTAFDGAILGWRYNIYPKFYLDAMGMARALGRTYNGASLATVLELENIGLTKGTFVLNARGKRLQDFNPHELRQYAVYCCNDTLSTVRLYKKYLPGFPIDALRIQDLILRLFIEPVLRFDKAKLIRYRDELVEHKWQTMAEVATLLGLTWEGQPLPTNRDALRAFDILSGNKITEQMATLLRSDAKLQYVLEQLGVDVPLKLSPTTGLPVPAFAKTDEAFIALLDHDDPQIAAVVSARLRVKTSIEQTRTNRFISIADRGVWPTLYTYYGAHTGRPTGGDKVNPMNLKRGGLLREAVLPPHGCVFVVGDLSQIECRMVNYVAEQDDVIKAFRAYDARQGPDVYCIFAQKIYGREITPKDKSERTVGKVGELSLGYGAGRLSYRQMLFTQANMRITLREAQNVVDIYRQSHNSVCKLWKHGNHILRALLHKQPFEFGRTGVLDGTHPEEGIGLPNGMYIRYPLLTQNMNDNGETYYSYKQRSGTVYIHGSKLVENVVQALANIVQQAAWLRLSERYRVVMNTYDELVIAVPEADAAEAAAYMRECLTQPVPWALDLPIACEVGIGENYGTCKR